MSRKHPIVAVTGSSGAGTSTVKNALEHIFQRVGARAAFIEGDSFHPGHRHLCLLYTSDAADDLQPV